MQFPEKLNFLINITHTSNKALAAALPVDRSLISLYRSGRRKMPKRREQLKKMAVFFAQHITADFQRHALSETLEQPDLRFAMPMELLAGHIERWLADETESNGQQNAITVPSVRPVPHSDTPVTPSTVSRPNPDTLFFYGIEGRQQAIRRAMLFLRSLPAPCPIFLTSDDNLDWLQTDYSLAEEVQAHLIEMAERGFTFHQIMPPMNYLNRYIEVLRFWLPIYSTGQIKVYYYPRPRDNLYRHSSIIVPGHYVHAVTSIAFSSSNHITLASTAPDLVREYTAQFQEHLSLCHPALLVHPDTADFMPCFRDIFSRHGRTIQMVDPLSVNTLPQALLDRCVAETDDPIWKATFQMYRDEIPHFEERLKYEPNIDISHLADAASVRAGKVFIASPQQNSSQIRYTPETYVLHLQNILRLMDEYENYHFIPYHTKEQMNYNLVVNENGLALLIRISKPMMLEIRRPEMVLACREHLLRRAEKLGWDKTHREKTRAELKALIRELQS